MTGTYYHSLMRPVTRITIIFNMEAGNFLKSDHTVINVNYIQLINIKDIAI